MVSLTYAMLNMKPKVKPSHPDYATIVDNINSISKLNEAFFRDDTIDGKKVKLFNMDFYEQKLPKVKVPGITFYGPTDALFNTVFAEYLDLVNYFNEYAISQDPNDLDLMVATIYRPKKPDYETISTTPEFDGDIRVKYNPNLTQHYAKQLTKLPFHVKHAIYLYVASCQHFITTNTALPIGSGNTIDLTILFEKKAVSSHNNLGLVGSLFTIAETKVFGNVKEVGQHNTYDILAFMVDQTVQYNKLKSRSNAAHT